MLLMIAILCMGPQASGRQLSGKVVEVLTGSKIVVNAKGKRFLVSLREADCPEPGQPYFKDALALTESLVDGQFVIVTIESANEDKIVGEVQYINSQNLSFQLLKAGMAFGRRKQVRSTPTRTWSRMLGTQRRACSKHRT